MANIAQPKNAFLEVVLSGLPSGAQLTRLPNGQRLVNLSDPSDHSEFLPIVRRTRAYTTGVAGLPNHPIKTQPLHLPFTWNQGEDGGYDAFRAAIRQAQFTPFVAGADYVPTAAPRPLVRYEEDDLPTLFWHKQIAKHREFFQETPSARVYSSFLEVVYSAEQPYSYPRPVPWIARPWQSESDDSTFFELTLQRKRLLVGTGINDQPVNIRAPRLLPRIEDDPNPVFDLAVRRSRMTPIRVIPFAQIPQAFLEVVYSVRATSETAPIRRFARTEPEEYGAFQMHVMHRHLTVTNVPAANVRQTMLFVMT